MKHEYLLFFITLLLLSLCSCTTSKYLDADDYLLTQNAIVLEEGEKIDNKRAMRYDLSTLYQQKPNGTFFFIPREWFYFATQDPKDTTNLDCWQRRVVGEPPAIYDEEKAIATQEAMLRYLNYAGYYDARVYYEPENKPKKQKISITYHVEPGRRYLIDSVFFSSDDPSVDSILQRISDDSYFEQGAGLSGKLYEQEKNRINDYLRNHGYAFFYPNFFPPIEVDTTLEQNRANIYMEVLPPFEDSLHRQFTVGSVEVYPQYDATRDQRSLQDTSIAGLRFKVPDFDFLVKPQTLVNSIFLDSGQTFRQEDYDRTNRQLSSLGIFRFVRIKQERDSLQPEVLNFRIELTPNPKMELGVDFELNYTNRSTTSGDGNLIGISASPSISNRNLLRGAELLVSNVSAGVEINPNPSDQRFWNTIDLRLQSDLYFPRFNDYLGWWRFYDRLPFGKKVKERGDGFYDGLREQAATRLSASYNYVLLLDFYRYNLLTASYGYDYQPSNNRRYFITHLAIDYFNPSTQRAFEELLQANPFLERSFGNQLFVSLFFREFNFVYNSRPTRIGESYYGSISVETAGTEVWAGNKIYNAFSLESDTLRIGETDFSQYFRIEGDGRYYRKFSPEQSLVARLNLGLARPFGFTQDVPYVKQFYAGGPNSIRGWAARELGPGGHIDSLTINTDNPLLFYQSGDLKFEFNLEYRFNIFWRLNGALFLDGGNVWTFRNDPSRPGSQFLLRSKVLDMGDGQQREVGPFYQQIALGTGFGMRVDLTYFIFRLDLGLKLRYPFEQDNGTHWNSFGTLFNDMNFNFGLGYPF